MSEEWDKINEELKADAAKLGEKYDSILLIATVGKLEDNSKVRKVVASSGNFYANYGAARDWVICMEEVTREWARSDIKNEGDDL